MADPIRRRRSWAASVIGRTFRYELLRTVSGLDEETQRSRHVNQLNEELMRCLE
jgi:hypothetical protein